MTATVRFIDPSDCGFVSFLSVSVKATVPPDETPTAGATVAA